MVSLLASGRMTGYRRPVITAEVDPWFLITTALVGREEAMVYWKSLDDTRDTLLVSNDIVKYQILKSLIEKKTLKPDQTEQFSHLTSLLPHLTQSVEKARKAKKLEAEAAAVKREKERASRKSAAAMSGLSRRDSNISDLTLIVEPSRRTVPATK